MTKEMVASLQREYIVKYIILV